MKKVVYTVITNNYDNLIPITKEEGYDYICFTDDEHLTSDCWNIRFMPKENDPVKQQRLIKLLPHKYLPEYDINIYMDANMRLKSSLSVFMDLFKGGMLVSAHPERKCVFNEAIRVIQLKKAKKEDVDRQMRRYHEMRFPRNFGMWADGFMIRDNSKEVIETCEVWAEELMQYTHRDQLSVSYAFRKTGFKPNNMAYRFMVSHIEIRKHNPKRDIKIFYSTPFRVDKNIGKANNDFINLLPDDCWVCITDGDALWLRPDWGKCIEDVIKAHGNEYGLIGCVTNRLGGLHQCYQRKFSVDMNMQNHYEIANTLWEEEGTRVDITTGVAGLCMIFKKETWKKAGGFKENIITADTEFNKSVKRLGFKIGLAKGLYMMHSYRVWETEHRKAWTSVKHLK